MTAHVETMFSAGGQVPWHQIGTIIEEEGATSTRALELAGLDWEVDVAPIFVEHPQSPVSYPVKDKKAVRRLTDGRVLGIVGNRYVPLQNREAFAFLDNLLLSKGAFYETAGSLKGGKVVWIMAKLPQTFEPVEGDTFEEYLLLSNSHDGSSCIQIRFTPVRVVCWNTLTAALNKGKDSFRISHTASIHNKIEQARTALNMVPVYYREVERFHRLLADTPMQDEQVKTIAARALELPIEQIRDNSLPARGQKRLDKLVRLFKEGVGNDNPRIRGSALAVLNAATEYDSYHAEVRDRSIQGKYERRIGSVLSGQGRTQQKVLDDLVKLVA